MSSRRSTEGSLVRNGLRCQDLAQPLLESGLSLPQLFGNTHYSSSGNRVLAEWMHGNLESYLPR